MCFHVGFDLPRSVGRLPDGARGGGLCCKKSLKVML